MEGIVKSIVEKKKFGFIKTGSTEYFFHVEDFVGHWDDLLEDFNDNIEIKVEFIPTAGKKGPRAQNVTRLDPVNGAAREHT